VSNTDPGGVPAAEVIEARKTAIGDGTEVRRLLPQSFVARSGGEIARAREDWVAGRLGQVHGYPGDPLAAPPLPGVPLKAR